MPFRVVSEATEQEFREWWDQAGLAGEFPDPGWCKFFYEVIGD